MKIRIYTETWEVALFLMRYLWFHPTLYDFIDWDFVEKTIPVPKGKIPRINLSWLPFLPLTNGSIFVIGPMSPRDDYGRRYDEYAEYHTDYNVPLDVLLLMLKEICKENSNESKENV